jgi:hypothetical protein
LSGAIGAPSAELARKCAALTAKAFPPRVIGNPAAGSAKGSGRSEQIFFNDCIKNGGQIEAAKPGEGAAPQSVSPSPEPPR